MFIINVFSPFGGANVRPAKDEDEAMSIFHDATCPFSAAPRVEIKTLTGETVKSWTNPRA